MRSLKIAVLLLTVCTTLPLRSSAQAQPSKPSEKKAVMLERLEFKNAKVVDAIRLIAEGSGLNIVATQAAGEKLVKLYLKKVTGRQAIDTLCRTSGLWYREDKKTGIIHVMTTEEYQKDLVIFREDKVKVFTLLHPNTVAVASGIADLFGSRVILSLGRDESFDTGGSGFGGSNSLGGRDTRTIGTFSGSSRGRRGSSFGSGFGDSSRGQARQTGDNRLGPEVKLTPEQIAEIERRRKEEGKPLSDALREHGQQERPIYITVNRQHNLIVVRTDDERALKEIERLIVEMDRPTPQVLLEMKILELDLRDDFKSIFDIGYTGGKSSPGPETGSPRNPLLGSATTGPRNVLGLGNFPLEGGTLIYQFLNKHVQARIQLLEGQNRVNVLGTPLLLCANNRSARIFVGEERPIVRNFQLQTNTTQGVISERVVPEVELQEIGITLRIVPSINADRTVTLRIQQDSSTAVIGGASIPIPLTSGGVAQVSVDTVNTANAEATIVGKDGLTVALGGLIREELTESESKIPLLGDLPLLGALFRRKVTLRSKKELILLITPYVLMTPQEGQDRTRARMRALSIHPYHDTTDEALQAFSRDEVPRAAAKMDWLEEFLKPIPDPMER